MVERSGRGKGKRKLLGSHQRSWLWGRNLVRETLLGGRWPIVELHLADDLPPDLLAEACESAANRGVRALVEPRDALERRVHTSEHQGYLAKMGPFPYASPDQLLATPKSQPLYVILDSIQDPFNFGAILRSAGAFGADGVVIGTRRQVPVTSLVARSSAGMVSRVPIVRVDDLADWARALRRRQVVVVGASEEADLSLTECDFRRPTALVLGNEGTGIGPELLACCDALARIPLAGPADSLNAAAAAAVFLFEVARQRSSP
jgi:23S rRNA (guanosine2251-2'-O)-methyltransferase